mgnify:CR=1 FL=1
MKLLLTIKEACETMSIGKSTLYLMMGRGDITPVKFGPGKSAGVRIRLKDIEDYIDSLQARTPSESA